ncbi:MAG TPA: PilT/PilU family type 4a pilus ATPase, partial [Phycisphaerae bacterium]|nr:PilT/PilU family type 4a pilus ATPase [Phycisphaerae bacterium]
MVDGDLEITRDQEQPVPRPVADHAAGFALMSLLAETVHRGASDLLLVAGAPPTVYTFGQWVPLDDHRLGSEEIPAIMEPVLTEVQRARLRDHCDLDFGLALPVPGADGRDSTGSVARYRVNVHYQRGTMAAAFRAIPAKVPPFERLGLPPEVRRFADFPNGLVLVTGCTGQGKSTTLAAIVDHMNRTRAAHVITIEDPIEFGFDHGTCLIEQRQIGEDSPSFASALRHVLRQRPDVILIGEMRDLETVATALTAAETGHLVLASLHTASAAQTLARIIDVFPPVQQMQVRTQLAASLRAIICQILVRDQANETLTPATEILVATSAIRRAIRDNETHLIYAMIETGKSQGMHTLEQSLAELVKSGRVPSQEALAAAIDPMRLAKLTGKIEKA